MNRRFLKRIFKAFEMMNMVHADPDGTGGDVGDGGGDEVSVAEYVGSKDVNPGQVPLIDEFDREGKSKEEIDQILGVAEGEFFMSDEQIEAKAQADKDKAEKDNNDKGDKDGDDKGDGTDDKGSDDKDGGDDKDDDSKGDKDDKKDGDGKESDEEKSFFKESGLTRETFNELPEATQEILVDKVMGKDASTEEAAKLKQDVENLNTQVADMNNDPVIAARMEERKLGKNIVAKAENFITDALMLKIDGLFADEKIADAKKLLTTEMNKQISNQNGVLEGQRLVRDLEKATWSNLRKLGKIDKRLIINEKDHTKMLPGHKEYMDFEKGPKQILDWARESGITNQSLSKMTPKSIYAAFSSHVGWDKDKEKNTFNAGKEALLKNLRNPKSAGAKSLKQDKQIAQGPGSTGGSVDRATLKAELVEGNTSNWEFMLEKSEGDPAKISELNEILQEAREEKSRAA